jgi:hypothetical protein
MWYGDGECDWDVCGVGLDDERIIAPLLGNAPFTKDWKNVRVFSVIFSPVPFIDISESESPLLA